MSHLTDDAHHGRTAVGAVRFDPLTRWEAANHVRDELTRGRGGRVVVLTQEQLRHGGDEPDAIQKPGRRTFEPVRPEAEDGGLVLVGSATAVWASRLAGTPLPERITGPGLTDALCAVCNSDRRRVYLVGGAPGLPGIPSAAQRAAAVLGLRHQGLRIAGSAASTSAVALDPDALDVVVADVVAAKPHLVLVGVEHPAAEQTLIASLRGSLAAGWLFGSVGLIRELAGDPGPRGGRRVHVSYAARLFARAAATRVSTTLHRL
jgi:N-acetylglucosaminyldiphosphoundecaprenol N-acetyl-beta-D-mannosaminyltransferase